MKKTMNNEIEEQYCSVDASKLLKEKGFNLPTPHCYVHDNGEDYYFELFSFYRGTFCNSLNEVYENEKTVRLFQDTDFISNESEIYFNYNQDIRKLSVRRYSGEDYMNDEKAYNMYMNSYSYEKLSYDEVENLKSTLPNYNDGDFDFGIYQDIVSAPSLYVAIEWIRVNYDIWISVDATADLWFYSIRSPSTGKTFVSTSVNFFNSPQEATDAALKYVLENLID